MVLVEKPRQAGWFIVAVVVLATWGAVGLFRLVDGGSGPGPPPTTTTRVTPTTTLPPIVRGWLLNFARSGLVDTSDEMRGARLASSLRFDADGTLSGGTGFGGGCDEFHADYVTDRDTISVGELTGVFRCTTPSAIAIRDRLTLVIRSELHGDELLLLGAGDVELLAYS